MQYSVMPIGTEYDYIFPPDRFSSSSAFTRFRYRVVAHDEVADRPGGPATMASRLNVIGGPDRFPCTEWQFTECGFRAVPPREIANAYANQGEMIAALSTEIVTPPSD